MVALNKGCQQLAEIVSQARCMPTGWNVSSTILDWTLKVLLTSTAFGTSKLWINNLHCRVNNILFNFNCRPLMDTILCAIRVIPRTDGALLFQLPCFNQMSNGFINTSARQQSDQASNVLQDLMSMSTVGLASCRIPKEVNKSMPKVLTVGYRPMLESHGTISILQVGVWCFDLNSSYAMSISVSYPSHFSCGAKLCCDLLRSY